MTYHLLTWPDPILSRRCEPVRVDQLGKLVPAIDAMLWTVDEHKALGIAANQVGCPLRVIVARIAGKLEVMINPVIKERWGARRAPESCLSVPGLSIEVTRSETIVVTHACKDCRFQIDGVPPPPPHEHPRLTLSGLEAAIVQHEIDHLDGKTLADLPAARRGTNREVLDKLRAQHARAK